MLKLLFILSFIITINNSEQNQINGFVYDDKTNETLCGVKVISDSDTTYTDFDGYFTIKYNKITKLSFQLISYQEKEVFFKDNNVFITNELKNK